ncbi:unnamed protein product [Closterium sp. Yama58-4]|nr:unnamed protein product [Closterium sp. Yama58-4]
MPRHAAALSFNPNHPRTAAPPRPSPLPSTLRHAPRSRPPLPAFCHSIPLCLLFQSPPHSIPELHSQSSPAIMLPSVAVALVLLAASIPASDAQVRPGCIRKYQCPRRGSNQCGLYYVCSESAKPKPPYTLQACDTCAFRDNVKAYAQVCNYATGRCSKNVIDGKPCTADAQCGKTGEFKCLVNKNSKANPKAKRCCRSKCPPGLCGYGKSPATYLNACGTKITCPGVCPKK